MKPLDSFTEDGVRLFIGRKVADADGKRVGTLRRVWLDPSTYQLEFAGIRTGWPFASTHIVPARDIRLDEESQTVQVEHPRKFVREAPRSNPEAELAEIEKEEIDTYYGYFVPLRRTSNIKAIRPEDALDKSGLPMATATADELLLHGEVARKQAPILNAS